MATRSPARVASLFLLAGAALLVVGNIAHPVDGTPSPTSRFAFADGAAWVPVHLVLALGFSGLIAGLVTLARVIGSPLARLASTFGAVGGSMMIVTFAALDGFATADLAPRWKAAVGTEREVLEAAATALNAIDSGLAATGTLLFFGLALVALGPALMGDARFSSRLGTATTVLGVIGGAAGVTLMLVGPTELTINALLRPLGIAATLLFVWLAVAARRIVSTTTSPADREGIVVRQPAGLRK